jgi:hypothetical protein
MAVKFSRAIYGFDRFSKITLTAGIFLIVTRYAWVLGSTLIMYSIWRSKSTNLHGRSGEKFVFESLERNFYRKLNDLKKNFKLKKINKHKIIEKLKDKRKYIITCCPKCAQKLRIPRGKGKIIITCSKCGSEFRIKT